MSHFEGVETAMMLACSPLFQGIGWWFPNFPFPVAEKDPTTTTNHLLWHHCFLGETRTKKYICCPEIWYRKNVKSKNRTPSWSKTIQLSILKLHCDDVFCRFWRETSVDSDKLGSTKMEIKWKCSYLVQPLKHLKTQTNKKYWIFKTPPKPIALD